MMTVIAILTTALLLSLAQTWWALTHHDPETGLPIGLHVFGAPLDLVMGAALWSLGTWLLDGVRADLATGIGLGALASYTCTWGKAIAHLVVMVRNGRDLEREITADADD